MRLSHTVSSVSRLSSCGTTPSRARMRGPSTAGSSPSTRSVAAGHGRDAADHPHGRASCPRRSDRGSRTPRRARSRSRCRRPRRSAPKRFVSARASISACGPGDVTAADASQRVRQRRVGFRSDSAATSGPRSPVRRPPTLRALGSAPRPPRGQRVKRCAGTLTSVVQRRQISASRWISRPVANRNGGSPGRGSSRSSS